MLAVCQRSYGIFILQGAEDQANTTMSCDLSAPNLGMGSDSIALEVVSNLSYPMTGF